MFALRQRTSLALAAAARSSTSSSRAFTTTAPRPLAKMQLIGRLAAEPELIPTSTGRDVIRYAVGTNHGARDKQEVSWFRVASFAEGPSREFILGLQKGTLVYVEAEGRMRTYQDSEGKKSMALDLVQQKIDVLSRPKSALEDGAGGEEGMAAGGRG